MSGEMRIADSPASVFASWARTDLDFVFEPVSTVAIGVRFNFGGDSLLERDRHGPSQGHAAVGGSFIF